MWSGWLSSALVVCAIWVSTSEADVISAQAGSDDKLYTSGHYNSASGFQVMRNRYLPNGIYIYGVIDPNHCVQSCVAPCTAADFDDADFTCWHHYGHLGCILAPAALYRPGITHYRNVVCGPGLNPSVISAAHSQADPADGVYLAQYSSPADSSAADMKTGDVVVSNPGAAAASYSSLLHTIGSTSQQQQQQQASVDVHHDPVCGRPALPPYEARIIGGDETRPNSWPWQIALRNKNSRSSRCAGSLIGPQWVLTTAHCVDQDTDPSHWLVLTGAHDLLAVETDRVAHSVDRVVIHKHFSLDTFDNDIALIRLTNPIQWGQTVSPVCLPPKDLDLPGGTKCVITGWGVASGGKRPLKQAGIPLVSVETCRRSDWLGSEFTITDRMMCAGFANGGVDTCQGDSGGPLLCYLQGRWVQAGVTSFGRGCGLPQKPGIYTKVSKFIQWINNIIKRKPSYV